MEEIVACDVEGFCLKGYGIARLPQGSLVEIAHTVPGDRVEVSWKKKRHPPQKGRLLRLLSPSSNRVEPRCQHVGICGGCAWQQMDYSAQLKEKQARVEKTFPLERNVLPILPAPEIYHYRNKMEFSFSQNRAGHRFFGLMIAQSEPYVFNVEKCHLGPSWFSLALQATRSWWEKSSLAAYNPPKDEGSLRYLTLRHAMRTDQKMAILNVSGNPEYALSREQIDEFTATLDSLFPQEISLFLRIHQTKKGVPTQFFEMHLKGPSSIIEELFIGEKTFSFEISPASFFQPNPSQAEKLYETALSSLGSTDVVYDLYCGTGTLGMVATQKAKEVIGIDLSSQAILDAQANAKRNQIENITFFQGDVGKILSEKNLPSPNVVIVDPPRAGLDPLALSHLKKLLAEKIIYISCNPTTQAMNIEELTHIGYRVVSIQPVDQFPHTYHIENIVVLAR